MTICIKVLLEIENIGREILDLGTILQLRQRLCLADGTVEGGSTFRSIYSEFEALEFKQKDKRISQRDKVLLRQRREHKHWLLMELSFGQEFYLIYMQLRMIKVDGTKLIKSNLKNFKVILYVSRSLVQQEQHLFSDIPLYRFS